MRTISYSISSTLGITEKVNSKKCSGNFFAWKFSVCTQVKFGGGWGGGGDNYRWTKQLRTRPTHDFYWQSRRKGSFFLEFCILLQNYWKTVRMRRYWSFLAVCELNLGAKSANQNTGLQMTDLLTTYIFIDKKFEIEGQKFQIFSEVWFSNKVKCSGTFC